MSKSPVRGGNGAARKDVLFVLAALVVLFFAGGIVAQFAGNTPTGFVSGNEAIANQPPVYNGPGVFNTASGVPLIIDLMQWFVDPEGDELTFIIAEEDRISVSMSGSIATLAPAPGFAGERVLTIIASDGTSIVRTPVKFVVGASGAPLVEVPIVVEENLTNITNETAFTAPVEPAIAVKRFALNEDVRDEANKAVGRKTADEADYETSFVFIGTEGNEFVLRFYHNATATLPIWTEGAQGTLSANTAGPNEQINLSVPLVNGQMPYFKLHVGFESEVFEFGTSTPPSEPTFTTAVAPSIVQVILNSTNPAENATSDDLVLFIINATDPEGSPVQNITDWRVNGSSLAIINMPFEHNTSDNFTVAVVGDYSHRRQNGTLGLGAAAASPTWVYSTTGVGNFFGGGYLFDASDDQINFTDPYDPTEYTLEAWVTPSLNTSRSILVRTASVPTASWSHQLRISSTGRFVHYTFDGAAQSVTGTTPVQANTTYHVVGTAKNNGPLRLFVNGVEEGTPDAIGTLWTPGDRWTIGSSSGDSMGFYSGIVHEVRIYNMSLNETQVQQLFKDGNSTNRSRTWVSNETVRGEVWSVCVTPNDNQSDGSAVCSNNLTIRELSVELNKTDAPDPVENGTLLNYSIVVGLPGDFNLNVYNLTLTDLYPPHVIFLSSQPSNATGTNNTFIIGNLTPGNVFQVNISVLVNNGTEGLVINNTANITYQDMGGVKFFQNVTERAEVEPPYGGCSRINTSTSLTRSISSRTTCITFGASHIFLNCSGNTITFGTNGSTMAYGIEARNLTNITVRDCIIMDNNSLGAFSIGINFTNVSHSFIFNNTILTNGSNDAYGILLSNSSNNSVQNNTVRTNGTTLAHGIFARFSSNNNTIFNNLVATRGTGVSNHGIYVTAVSSDARILNNSVNATSSANGAAVVVQSDSRNAVIANNTLRALSATASNWGIYLLTSVSNAFVAHNNISANATTNNFPIHLDTGSDNHTIMHNYINVSGSSNNFGIILDTGARNNVVANNSVVVARLDGGAQVGIQLISTAINNTIANNTIRTNGTTSNFGIQLTTTANGNFIFGNFIVTGGTTGSNYGIFVTASSNNTIANNSVNTTGTATNTGIRLVTTVSNNTVVNNTVRTSGSTTDNIGILLSTTAHDNNVSNNVIYTNGTSVNYGISLETTASRNSVFNNTIHSGGSTTFNRGIVLFGVTTSVTFNNITSNVIYTAGTSNASGIVLSTRADNNTIADNIIFAGSGSAANVNSIGIHFGAVANNNNITNNRINTTGNLSHGISLENGMQNNRFVGNNISTSGANSFAVNILRSNSTIWSNNTFTAPSEWILSGANNLNNFTNTTFVSFRGSIRITEFALNGTLNVSRQRLNVSFNQSFLNSTNLTALNISSQVTLDGITFTNPEPTVDFEDDGSFVACPASVCTEISYSGGAFVFNVTQFTSFSAQEGGAAGEFFNVTNITITKTDAPDPVLMSSFLNYTIFVNVTGNGTAYNVTVNDTYPNQTIFLTSQPPPLTGTNNTWILGNLSAGTNFSINISLIPTNITNNISINNSVNVTFQNETSQAFQSRNVTINTTIFEPQPILNSTNITVTKTDSPDPVTASSFLNYTIFINVTGNGTAYNVTVNDTYPNQTIFLASSPAPLTGTNNTWVLGNLTQGTSFRINISLLATNVTNSITINNSVNATFQNETSQAFQSRNVTINTSLVLAVAEVITNFTNISIAKTDSPDPVLMSSFLNYTIFVNVTGNGTAYNVTVNDTYPNQTIYLTSQPAPLTGTNNTWILGNLTVGTNFSINISLIPTNVTNNISINNSVNASFQNETSQGFQSYNISINTTIFVPPPILNSTNMTVTKTESPDPVLMSSFLNYTIFVNVTGNGTAFNVTVNDTYPNQTIFLTSSPAPLTGTNNTWILGNLTQGTNFSINISLIPTNVTNNISINNSVNVTFQNETSQAFQSRNVTINTTIFTPPPTLNSTNITVTKVDVPDPVLMSTFLNYTIFVNVTGNGTAYNVTVNDTYPNQTIFLTSQPATLTGTNNTWILGNLTAGTNFSINISLLVNNVSNEITINNSANATFQNETSQAFQSRNVTISTTVQLAPPVINFTNVSVTKTDSPDPVNMSGFLNYTIFVNVTGNGTAYNVTVNDTYPNQTIFLTSIPAPLTGTNNTWIIGNLTIGTNFSINVSLLATNVSNNLTINNSANVTFQNETSQAFQSRNATINTSVLFVVTPPVTNFTNVSITKTDSPDPVENGTQLNYTIVVNITGNGTAFNLTINDTYSNATIFNSAQPSPLTGTNNTFVLGNLTPGTSFSINITVNVTQIANGTLINNTANVTFQNETSQAFQSRVANTSTIVQNVTVEVSAPAPAPTAGGGSVGGGGGGVVPAEEPELEEPICVENWECEAWSECVGGRMVRTCVDINKCGSAGFIPHTDWPCAAKPAAVEEEVPVRVQPIVQPVGLARFRFWPLAAFSVIIIILVTLGYIAFGQGPKPPQWQERIVPPVQSRPGISKNNVSRISRELENTGKEIREFRKRFVLGPHNVSKPKEHAVKEHKLPDFSSPAARESAAMPKKRRKKSVECARFYGKINRIDAQLNRLDRKLRKRR